MVGGKQRKSKEWSKQINNMGLSQTKRFVKNGLLNHRKNATDLACV